MGSVTVELARESSPAAATSWSASIRLTERVEYIRQELNAHEAIRQAGRSGRIRLRVFHDRDLLGVEIEDNGCGISPQVLSKIFDPGFTTKGVQVGTGLGLAICYQIVQGHQGRISVHSREGVGTRFAVLFPVNRKGLSSARSVVTR
jgi:C4-dicarboxylate-specific signal transduction histidine kinase